MPPRDWRVRITDIIDAIGRIESYIRDMSPEEFERDKKTFDAVLRNLTVIGEASRHIPADIQDRYPNVPWREMQGIRNVVVHDYHGVSAQIIWSTATRNLPPLPEMLKTILEKEK